MKIYVFLSLLSHNTQYLPDVYKRQVLYHTNSRTLNGHCIVFLSIFCLCLFRLLCRFFLALSQTSFICCGDVSCGNKLSMCHKAANVWLGLYLNMSSKGVNLCPSCRAKLKANCIHYILRSQAVWSSAWYAMRVDRRLRRYISAKFPCGRYSVVVMWVIPLMKPVSYTHLDYAEI